MYQCRKSITAPVASTKTQLEVWSSRQPVKSKSECKRKILPVIVDNEAATRRSPTTANNNNKDRHLVQANNVKNSRASACKTGKVVNRRLHRHTDVNHSKATKRAAYLDYGKSSDRGNDDTLNPLPNPYAELAKKLNKKADEGTTDEAPTIKSLDTPVKKTLKDKVKDTSGDQLNPYDGYYDDDENEEDDDEEGEGAPQAVRAMQFLKPQSSNKKTEIIDHHKLRMEEVARNVSTVKLLHHLRSAGYFNYSYARHARTSVTNLNLHTGKKKGMEKLITLLNNSGKQTAVTMSTGSEKK
ncbi:uncharacterized protein LOC131951067 [Physella acuta]|uniref:uncharacterized protein LOC131951067 n=1 Tax=Physella acuta TaxID=109671 RepID=UPI0027DE0716|nr:uncharacterized protein LOC131951067 [Physella acuta]